jgi:YbgC/YbaW family acyl-CoA thioester hydrolase
MAGIVHFSAYFKYMEAAEHAFFRSLGFSVVTRIGHEIYGWPRVHAECDFNSPLRFEDEFDIHLLVREVRSKAIVFDFIFTTPAEQGARRIGRGSFTTVCVTKKPDGTMTSSPIPAAIAERIQPAPAERLESR